uniref:Uncharacterized protein n=1 Tax=Ascaris lumbricoides TaxID=6252 RepID=A0A0M3I8S3_ASCLU
MCGDGQAQTDRVRHEWICGRLHCWRYETGAASKGNEKITLVGLEIVAMCSGCSFGAPRRSPPWPDSGPLHR